MPLVFGEPTNKIINNGTSNVIRGMPLKELNSDNDSTFSMGRRIYGRALNMTAPTLIVEQQKKWLQSRDSSSFIDIKKNRALGVGSLNATGESISFTNGDDINETRRALSRTRNNGYIVPKKVTGSNAPFK